MGWIALGVHPPPVQTDLEAPSLQVLWQAREVVSGSPTLDSGLEGVWGALGAQMRLFQSPVCCAVRAVQQSARTGCGRKGEHLTRFANRSAAGLAVWGCTKHRALMLLGKARSICGAEALSCPHPTSTKAGAQKFRALLCLNPNHVQFCAELFRVCHTCTSVTKVQCTCRRHGFSLFSFSISYGGDAKCIAECRDLACVKERCADDTSLPYASSTRSPA